MSKMFRQKAMPTIDSFTIRMSHSDVCCAQQATRAEERGEAVLRLN